MPIDHIIVKGARENNLQNISFEFPKNKLIVFTGVSGSGKSSMAFDTLFAEGQRRYVESLSSYARQFLGNLKRPDVDLIEGLSPSIAINQKAISHNPRSTVGTVTEIYDYLRLLFARVGHPHCPNCNREVSPQTGKQIVSQIIDLATTQLSQGPVCRFLILAPLVRDRKGDFHGLTDNLRKSGYKWIRVDSHMIDLYSDYGIAKTNKHNIDAVIDRVSLTKENLKSPADLYTRLIDSVEQAMKLSNGLIIFSHVSDTGFTFPDNPTEFKDTLFSENFACPVCNISLPPVEPRLFSFNSPTGACPECKGLGSQYQIDRSKFPEWKAKYLEDKYFSSTSEIVREELEHFMIKKSCRTCHGSRLNPESLSVKILDQNIYQTSNLPINNLHEWLVGLPALLNSDKEKEILSPINQEILSRLDFLLAVGLDYLSLDREAGTLSSGESQRIRLASQIGTGLTGVLYILDEPTIGLHSRDNNRLISTLKKLRDIGNTVIVVEHDEDVIRNADHIVDFGLLAGKNGGTVVAQGSISDIENTPASLTGRYLSGKSSISLSPSPVSSLSGQSILTLSGCRQWNLKNITVTFPLNKLVCVTGVSGSGKSTLVHDTLYAGVRKALLGSYYGSIGTYDSITGFENLSDVLLVDQSPIGRTPRSNPATYTKVFDDIRNLFAQTTESQIRGFTSGRFSFNVKGGRCEACQGQGQIKIEMQFLPDIYVTCDECHGTRFKDETLEVFYKEKNIDETLKLTVDEAADFFKHIPSLKRKLNTIQEVGLGYLQLGQPSNTLSGGESQRLKISRELVKKINGRILYVLDEPTTGLHFYDIDKLIKVLRRLVDMGNTVVLIEHNLDVIKNSDWIIDLGPEGGDRGGYLVASGSVTDITNNPQSSTGFYLKSKL
ncbi:MAG: excinuclease ABC subunit UvrA [Candidatus Shapirobacteria bacterium]|jgi:excinuclease ABC subunit A